MNAKIKEILENKLVINDDTPDFELHALNSAIIEICEAQKKECADIFIGLINKSIIKSKNIAQ